MSHGGLEENCHNHRSHGKGLIEVGDGGMALISDDQRFLRWWFSISIII